MFDLDEGVPGCGGFGMTKVTKSGVLEAVVVAADACDDCAAGDVAAVCVDAAPEVEAATRGDAAVEPDEPELDAAESA